MRNVCCFDIGGTFTKYGVISEQGELIFSKKVETPKENCKDTIPVLLVKLIDDIRKNYDIDCIGVSTAGKVGDGRILYASTILPDYTGADIKGFIEEKTTLHCEVDNDTYCAALGEMWKGTAQGYENFATITYGTGIGGAVVINGEIYKGANLGAMGIGHLIIDMDGIDCTCDCNMKGVYECYATIPLLLKDFNVSGEKFIDLIC